MSYDGDTDIYVDTRAKDYLKFLGIEHDTLEDVRSAAHVLAPHKEEIVNYFYKQITQVPHLESIISNYSTVERLRKTMQIYLDQFLAADLNEDYIKTRITVGEVHSRISLTADHFISAHHMLMQMMTSILMEKLQRKPNQLMASVLAIQKLAAFDQQLIVGVYMEDTFKSFLFDISGLLNHTTQLDTTKNLVVGMDKQIEETHSVSAATEQMSASINEVADYAMNVAESTGDAVVSAEESKEIIHHSLDDIKNVGTVYEDVVEKVSQLDREIEHTQSVVGIIKDIAEQTNLLALNASIEAARAGEHGRGFSVVASEVRNLSENTQHQIKQITSNIDALQHLSREVTDRIKKTGKWVEQSVDGAEQAGDALSMIVSTMSSINESISQIAAMSEEQTSTVMDIAQRNTNIYDLSSETVKIARETGTLVFDLSKQMDDYRNSFFNINVELNGKDIMKVTKTDHLLLKWKVYNTILGIGDVKSEDFHACSFYNWLQEDLRSPLKDNEMLQKIEESHEAIHQLAALAVKQHGEGKGNEAHNTYERLATASDTFLSLVSEIESTFH